MNHSRNIKQHGAVNSIGAVAAPQPRQQAKNEIRLFSQISYTAVQCIRIRPALIFVNSLHFAYCSNLVLK
jgi:hypothetical protein